VSFSSGPGSAVDRAVDAPAVGQLLVHRVDERAELPPGSRFPAGSREPRAHGPKAVPTSDPSALHSEVTTGRDRRARGKTDACRQLRDGIGVGPGGAPVGRGGEARYREAD
jgi:hypothetical protein